MPIQKKETKFDIKPIIIEECDDEVLTPGNKKTSLNKRQTNPFQSNTLQLGIVEENDRGPSLKRETYFMPQKTLRSKVDRFHTKRSM